MFKYNNNNIFNLLFMMMLIISTLFSINSNNWINAWIGMEINLLSFIPLMKNKNNSSNSMMIYFIIQALASSLIMFTLLIMKLELNLNLLNQIYLIMQISLLMKLGVPPFHWWVPKIFIYLNWKNSFIFLTWQKITPILLMNSFYYFNFILYTAMIYSTIIGAIMGLNQSSIKLIILYSSINHLGWMIMSLMMNLSMLIFYFIIYSLMIFMICLIMNNLNLTSINQLIKNFNHNIFLKTFMMSLFLSLGGLPPFVGFFPKLMVLHSMIINNLFIESFLFVIMATITLSFYMNPLLSILLTLKMNLKWNNYSYYFFKSIFNILLLNINFSLMILFIFLKIYF